MQRSWFGPDVFVDPAGFDGSVGFDGSSGFDGLIASMATMVFEALEGVQVNYGNLEDVFAIEGCTKLVENEQMGSVANADFER